MIISFNKLGNYGNLGNQLFQYCALRGIAIKNNAEICFPHKQEFGKIQPEVFTCLDNCFNINMKYERGYKNYSILNETTYNFDNKFFNIQPKNNVNIEGYFQTEKYFKHIENELKNELIFNKDVVVHFNKKYKNLFDFNNFEYISVHIRRTDFIKFKNIHYNCPLSYYQNAIDILKKDNKKIILFSDDLEWCLQQKIFQDSHVIPFDEIHTYISLYAMTLCNYHIIANSSFSWWGSWLSKSKKTIAPALWFTENVKKNTDDIYCQEWLKI